MDSENSGAGRAFNAFNRLMDMADKTDILQRWSAFQRALGRPERELTWYNCVRELDLDKLTR
jgi:hypothetical protein